MKCIKSKLLFTRDCLNKLTRGVHLFSNKIKGIAKIIIIKDEFTFLTQNCLITFIFVGALKVPETIGKQIFH
jgi:hypothetical protein